MSDSEEYYFGDSDHSQDQEDDDYIEEENDYEEEEEEKHTEVVNTEHIIAAKFLDEQDLIHNMNEVIRSVSSLLSLPPYSCTILLCNFYWDVLKLQDVWFSDQSRACQSAGLLLIPTTTHQTRTTTTTSSVENTGCPICFTSFHTAQFSSAACGHLFCHDCWKQYISIAIADGSGCLTLRCPAPRCSVSVDHDLINTFASTLARARYKMLQVNNFVECSKGIKWCPASPGCQYAIQFTSIRGQEDVTCKCTCTFCWDCGVEPHRPVDCETALKWQEKNNADSLNTDWLLFNSKPCPKCKRSIEKNQGCNHMTCTPPCGHNFCWLCLGDWIQPPRNFHICNKLPPQDESSLEEEQVKVLLAQLALVKYTHYYERWLNNCSSGNKALESLNGFKAQTMSILSKLYCETDAVLERSFVYAWKQIVECRRLLRWTYAYGYYLPEDQDVKKRTLFEDLQGQAEGALERLHHCVEKELEKYLKVVNGNVKEEDVKEEEIVGKDLLKEFSMYRVKVTELTNTTRKFFDNLLQALETWLI